MKTDNSHLPEKLALRRHFLERFPARRRRRSQRPRVLRAPRVFDACQGSGVIWSVLRREYPCEYWGVDVKRKPGRLSLDSARILEQPGWRFDVIDIDTYGSPWKHYLALLPRVRRPVTVFLTVGLIRAGGGGNVGKAFLEITGLGFRRLSLPPSLAARLWDTSLARCLGICYRHGVRPVYAAEIPVEGNVRYVGIRLAPAGKEKDA